MNYFKLTYQTMKSDVHCFDKYQEEMLKAFCLEEFDLDKINKKPLTNDTLTRLLESSEIEAPPEFCCPISQMIMKDPVKTIDNQIYDKEQIQKWFINHNTSPLTGLPLASKALAPNTELKNLIIAFVKEKSDKNNTQ